jgi:hypothetical protein
LSALNIGALENTFGVAEPELVADGSNVGRHSAVAERDKDFCPATNLVDHFEVVLIANGTFDEAEVNVCGVFLDVHDRAEDKLDLAGEFDKELVKVEE